MYFKAKSSHMEILDVVLAYKLLNSANPINMQKQLVKATVSKMDYQIMDDQPKKIFTSTSTNVHNKTEAGKTDVQPEENNAFYKSRGKDYRQQ